MAGAVRWTARQLTDSYTIGDTVEDFALPNLEGRSVQLTDVAGTWTVLYFTATWCPYCTAEAPYIEDEVVSAFAGRDVGLVVIGV
jgi:peroxiredoxin